MIRKKLFVLNIVTVFTIGQFVYTLPSFSKEELSFKNKFIEFTSDGILDKVEFDYLKKIAETSKDKYFAEDAINNLSKYKDRIKLEYKIEDIENERFITLNFVFSPTYSEDEKIQGKNVVEIISNISQKDNLVETTHDDERCGTASLINAYLLMGGSFRKVANMFGLTSSLTYKNIHIVQEKLFKFASSGKYGTKDGLYSGYKYKFYPDGVIVNIKASGEIVTAADKIGVEIFPLLGKTVDTIDDKKYAVENFMQKKPDGVIQVGVYLDLHTGKIYPPSKSLEQNHFITIFKLKDDYYIADTSSVNNGDGKNVRKMYRQEIEDLIYNTSGIINGLFFKKNP